MTFPISTGQLARLLGVPEPRINDLVRRERVSPPPPIVAGRRQWHRDHVLAAAAALGVATDDLSLDQTTARLRDDGEAVTRG